MEKQELHIVALPYYEVGACLDEFMSEAIGRAMTLKPEPTNPVDANAIRAYDWQGRHIGYVASCNLELAWQLLRGSGRPSLRGSAVAVNKEHKCVTFCCEVETVGEEQDIYPQGPFTEWIYTGPLLKPTEVMTTLEYMPEELWARLDERPTWDDCKREDFLALLERFCTLSQYDISGDMEDYRRRLYLRLMETDDEALHGLADELRMSIGRMGRSLKGGDILNYWLDVLSSPRTVSALLPISKNYDVEEVRSQLENFPEELYDIWLHDRGQFIQKVRYLHIQSEVLWRLVSGIAFVEIMTRREEERLADEMQEESAGREASAHHRMVPRALKSQRAEELMDCLMDACMLDEDWQPKGLSGTQRALVARTLGNKLGISDVWQVFGRLWNMKPETLRSLFNKALDQKKSLAFQGRLAEFLN